MDTELNFFYDSLGSEIGTPTIEGPSPLEKIKKREERVSQEELLDSPPGEGNIGTSPPAVPMFPSASGNIRTASDRTYTNESKREAQILRIMEFERYRDTITAFSFTVTTNRPASIKNATDVFNLVKWICFRATDMDNKMNNENLFEAINWRQLEMDAQHQNFSPLNTGLDQLLLAIKVHMRFGFLTPAVVIVGDQRPEGRKDDKAILHFSDLQDTQDEEERMASIFIPCIGLSASYIDLCTAALLSKLYGLGGDARPEILAYPRRINTGMGSRQTAFIVIFTSIQVNADQSEHDRMLQHAAIRNHMLTRFLDIEGNPVEHGCKITLLGPIHWLLTSLSQHHFTCHVVNINEYRLPKVLQLNDCPFNWEQMARALSHTTDISNVLFVSCTPEPAHKRWQYRIYATGNLASEVFTNQCDFRTTIPKVDLLLEKNNYPTHYSLTVVPDAKYYRAEQAWLRKFQLDLAQTQQADLSHTAPPPPTTTTPMFHPASGLTTFAQACAAWQSKEGGGAPGGTKPAGGQRTYAQAATPGPRRNTSAPTPPRASYTAHTTRDPAPTNATVVDASLLNQVVSLVENRLSAKNAAAEKVRADAASAKEASLNATLKQMADTQSAIMQMLTHLSDPSPHKRNRPADAPPPFAPTLPFSTSALGEGTENAWQSPPSSPAGASGFHA